MSKSMRHSIKVMTKRKSYDVHDAAYSIHIIHDLKSELRQLVNRTGLEMR
jgi:hypothetical protein